MIAKCVFIMMLLVLCFGCKDKNTAIQFISTNEPIEEDVITVKEFILIKNAPLNKDSSWLVEYEYFKKHHKICSLVPKNRYYGMDFYRKTSCTSYFIDNEQDYGGFSRSVIFEDCIKDAEHSFYYKRDAKNPNKWISQLDEKTWGVTYYDTIYCNKK